MSIVNFSFGQAVSSAVRKRVLHKIQRWPGVRTVQYLRPHAKSVLIRRMVYIYLHPGTATDRICEKLLKQSEVDAETVSVPPRRKGPVPTELETAMFTLPAWLVKVTLAVCPTAAVLPEDEVFVTEESLTSDIDHEVRLISEGENDRAFIKLLAKAATALSKLQVRAMPGMHFNSPQHKKLQFVTGYLRSNCGTIRNSEHPLRTYFCEFESSANDMLTLVQKENTLLACERR